MLCCILKEIQNHNVMNTMNFKGNILSETSQPVTKDWILHDRFPFYEIFIVGKSIGKGSRLTVAGLGVAWGWQLRSIGLF